MIAYSVEAYLAYEEYIIELGTAERIRREGMHQGVSWDNRTQAEVVTDLKKQGIPAYPAYSSQLGVEHDGLEVDGKRFFPLGGLANITTVFCNETGQWSIYPSDEYGFNNPKGAWGSGDLEAALIGDSFVNGACEPPGQDLASYFREGGMKSVSVGIGGTGPLLQLGMLKEYVKPEKPPVVFWFFYGVDIRDGIHETQSATLMRYLTEPGFSQNLREHNDEIQRLLQLYLDSVYDHQLEKLVQTRQERREIIKKRLWQKGLKLTKLRERIRHLGGRDTVTEGREIEKLDIIRRIFLEAKHEVDSWGGKLIFVYLPDWYHFKGGYDTYGIKVDENFLLRLDVLKTVQALGIPTVDLHREMFAQNPDPLSLFNHRTYGHYTSEAYRQIATIILQRMKDNQL